jgi:glycosyltransferase involved in cell wall biosynthesis
MRLARRGDRIAVSRHSDDFEAGNQEPRNRPIGDPRANISVDIVIPVLNEAHVLSNSIQNLRGVLGQLLSYRWRIVIVDNGSSDGTDEAGRRLAAEFPDVSLHRLAQRGRGRALRHAWLQSSADLFCYMDVDLSTDLGVLPTTLDSLVQGGYDIAVGSRLMRESQIKRSVKREFISRAYNVFVRRMLHTRFSDAQCGFKALTRQAVQQLVPQIKDQAWFFDTELLVLAENQGYRIKDIPVTWNEDTDSRVKIIRTAWEDIKGVFRLRRYLRTREFASATVHHGKQVQTGLSR